VGGGRVFIVGLLPKFIDIFKRVRRLMYDDAKGWSSTRNSMGHIHTKRLICLRNALNYYHVFFVFLVTCVFRIFRIFSRFFVSYSNFCTALFTVKRIGTFLRWIRRRERAPIDIAFVVRRKRGRRNIEFVYVNEAWIYKLCFPPI